MLSRKIRNRVGGVQNDYLSFVIFHFSFGYLICPTNFSLSCVGVQVLDDSQAAGPTRRQTKVRGTNQMTN